MKKAKFIKKEDLLNLQEDENGNYLIPEGIEIYIKETPEEVKVNRIKELEKELSKMTEPTEQELIEEARVMHPFYMNKLELEILKKS